MITSENINDLALALSKAQSEMTGAKKDSKNPFFKSNYSDLASVMEAISKPFADNDLCFVQGVEANDNKVAVVTRIIHKSGQWIEATTELPPTKADAQGWGSSMTYGKRYGLQALAGVPSVDDDGQAATVAKTAPVQKNKDMVVKFANIDTMDNLALMWGSLSQAEHKLYVKDKELAKKRIAP